LYTAYYSPNGEVDIGAGCHTLRPDNTDLPTLWEVTAEYSSECKPNENKDGEEQKPDGSGDQNSQQANPEDEKTRRRWSSQSWEETVDVDILNDPIVNSAGDKFDPLPTVTQYGVVISFTKKKLSGNYDAATEQAIVGYINESSFMGFGPHACLIIGQEAEEVRQDNQDIILMTTQVLCRKSGTWLLKLIDNGPRQLAFDGFGNPLIDVDGNQNLVPCMKDGVQVISLLKDGKMWNGPPEILIFQLNDETNFNNLDALE